MTDMSKSEELHIDYPNDETLCELMLISSQCDWSGGQPCRGFMGELRDYCMEFLRNRNSKESS